MKKPIYNAAPLPFMGQKRRFLGEFRKALATFPDARVFVDLFGGSGLLSHTVKQERPDAQVIYNDYDGYHLRLANIPRTNALLADLRQLAGVRPKGQRLPDDVWERILQRVKEEEQTGFVDYITLSSWLLFSGKYVTSFEQLAKQGFYNNLRQEPYRADGYLEGVEIVQADYHELFEQYRHAVGGVFIVDPPYLSTEVGAYKCYWKLGDYLDVLKVLDGQSYVYFSSTKSQIVELMDWVTTSTFSCNPFADAERREQSVTINHSAHYTDIMLFKAQSSL